MLKFLLNLVIELLGFVRFFKTAHDSQSQIDVNEDGPETLHNIIFGLPLLQVNLVANSTEFTVLFNESKVWG